MLKGAGMQAPCGKALLHAAAAQLGYPSWPHLLQSIAPQLLGAWFQFGGQVSELMLLPLLLQLPPVPHVSDASCCGLDSASGRARIGAIAPGAQSLSHDAEADRKSGPTATRDEPGGSAGLQHLNASSQPRLLCWGSCELPAVTGGSDDRMAVDEEEQEAIKAGREVRTASQRMPIFCSGLFSRSANGSVIACSLIVII